MHDVLTHTHTHTRLRQWARPSEPRCIGRLKFSTKFYKASKKV